MVFVFPGDSCLSHMARCSRLISGRMRWSISLSGDHRGAVPSTVYQQSFVSTEVAWLESWKTRIPWNTVSSMDPRFCIGGLCENKICVSKGLRITSGSLSPQLRGHWGNRAQDRNVTRGLVLGVYRLGWEAGVIGTSQPNRLEVWSAKNQHQVHSTKGRCGILNGRR